MPMTAPPKAAPRDFGDGKYTILLLKRRDIPRKIISIKNLAFELKLCNIIRVTLKNPSSQRVQMRISKTTNNSCDMKEEDQYLNYLGQAQSYYKDEEDFIVKDEKGI